MSDLGELIAQKYVSRVQGDSKLREIGRSIRNGGGYADAEKYAVRAGEVLSEVLRENITADNFPVGAVDEIAKLIIPSIRMNYEANSQASALAQKTLNTAGGLGMNPIATKYDESAAMNIAGRMAKYESFEDAEWLFNEPMVTNSISTVDKALHENADFQYKSGLRPKIIRTCESDACEWCQMLEGEYDYEEVKDRGNPVYLRHNNCTCEIVYEPGEGRVEHVDFGQGNDKEEAIERISKHQTLVNAQNNHDSNRASKLKYKLDIRFFGKSGAVRAANHEKNWTKASLKETINKYAPNSSVMYTSGGKEIYRTPGSPYTVVYDTQGNYFRIRDDSLKGREIGKRCFVGLDGSDLNYYTDSDGNRVRRSLKQYDKLTHFKNSD